MRHSTRVLTVLSLAVLCSLSFPTVNAQNTADTHRRDVLLHRRAIHHLRATSSNTPTLTPTSTPASTPVSSPSPSVATTSNTPSPTSDSFSTSSTPTPSSDTSPTDSSTSPVQSTPSSQPPDSTTSTTPTTSKPSTTPSSTPPTSSGTTSSPSSSTTPTTSATPAQSNLPIGGSTTHRPSNSPVSSGFSVSSDPGSTVYATPTAGAASKGFFGNKAAVGATFSIIGIICGLAAIIGAITLIKRYRKSRQDEDDFFEKYPGVPGSANHSRFSRELGTGPLGASATDLSFDAAPPSAYPDRAIHYGAQPPTIPSTVFRPVDYGIDYPPNAAYAAAATEADVADSGINTDIAYADYDYDPNNSPRRSTSAGSHPFADPANAPRTAAAPPVSYPRGRAQEMVTVDSYYGPNSAGVGAAGVGYAQ